MKIYIISLMFFALSCVSNGSNSRGNQAQTQIMTQRQLQLQPDEKDTSIKSAIKRPEALRQSYKVIKTYPHSTNAYTQGLYYQNGFLYEGTGLEGESYLRKVDLETGKVLKEMMLSDDNLFGEGIALVGNKIYQLTWLNGTGFIYNTDTFEKIDEFKYTGEGWGLTTDGKMLYMSDGSEKIYVIDPETLKCTRIIEVYSNNGPIKYLNELEWIEGEIWANVYQTDNIVRIDPETGTVKSIMDMSGLLKPTDRTIDTDVLNGIAYDSQTKRIFVTGKKWGKLFEIKVE